MLQGLGELFQLSLTSTMPQQCFENVNRGYRRRLGTDESVMGTKLSGLLLTPTADENAFRRVGFFIGEFFGAGTACKLPATMTLDEMVWICRDASIDTCLILAVIVSDADSRSTVARQ
jgi:hypothetical protein